MGGGGGKKNAPPENVLDFNSLKSPFLALCLNQTNYSPVPVSSDETLRTGRLFLHINYNVGVECSKAIFVGDTVLRKNVSVVIVKNLHVFSTTLLAVWIRSSLGLHI